MKRVIILGCSGSGKSVFSLKLQEKTDLPLIHLDNVWWNKDRTHISRQEFDRKLSEILIGEQWIIEGDYSRTYEVRLKACDTVLFLDFDAETCLEGIRERVGKNRPDIPWTEEELDPALVRDVENYHSEKRPVLLNLLESYTDKQVHVFTDRQEAYKWLEEMETE